MQYKVTLEMVVKTRVDEDRLYRQVESVWEFGTVREAIVEALDLNESPILLSLSVRGRTKACLLSK